MRRSRIQVQAGDHAPSWIAAWRSLAQCTMAMPNAHPTALRKLQDQHTALQQFLVATLTQEPHLANQHMSLTVGQMPQTPLDVACSTGADRCLEAAIQHGGDPSAVDARGAGIVERIIETVGYIPWDMCEKTLDVAIAAGAPVNQANMSGMPPLMSFIANSTPRDHHMRRMVITKLLQSGAQPHPHGNPMHAMRVAAMFGKRVDAMHLLDSGAYKPNDGPHPAITACSHGFMALGLDILKQLPTDVQPVLEAAISSPSFLNSEASSPAFMQMMTGATSIPRRERPFPVPSAWRRSTQPRIRLIGWAWHVEDVAIGHHGSEHCEARARRCACPVPITDDLQAFCLRSIMEQPGGYMGPCTVAFHGLTVGSNPATFPFRLMCQHAMAWIGLRPHHAITYPLLHGAMDGIVYVASPLIYATRIR